jgi:hypothetical protein
MRAIAKLHVKEDLEQFFFPNCWATFLVEVHSGSLLSLRLFNYKSNKNRLPRQPHMVPLAKIKSKVLYREEMKQREALSHQSMASFGTTNNTSNIYIYI